MPICVNLWFIKTICGVTSFVHRLLLLVEIIVESFHGFGSDVGDVALYLTMLHQQDACGDVDGVSEIVRTDDYRRSRGLSIFLDDMLEQVLTRRIEEVERFIEDEKSRMCDEGRDDSHLLLVAR